MQIIKYPNKDACRFLHFLKENRLYGLYIKEVTNPLITAIDRNSPTLFERRGGKTEFIRGAFYWGSSKYGSQFWSKIHEQWIDEIMLKIR